VNATSCEHAVHRAYDKLAGLLPPEDRVLLDDHLASCDRCADLMADLRSTLAVVRRRHELDASVVLGELEIDGDGTRGSDLVRHLPQLYALAVALDPAAADDLVQETISRTLADPIADTTDAALAATLTHLAVRSQPTIESSPMPTPGDDPDADTAELFYPAFYTDAADPGGWVQPAVAWGEARVLQPEDDIVTTELYGVVDAALGRLDPIDRTLLTLVDIDGAPFGQAVMVLDIDRREARTRLARGRSAVRDDLARYIRD
jgi:DNA-directed RNA polymerase specialized sigma24 family protein